MRIQPSWKRVRRGFTLVGLAGLIVIIGVVALSGVPKFLNSVERLKASEAFAYLTDVRTAQERYLTKEGIYTTDPTDLDLTSQAPKYFAVGTISVVNTGSTPSWSCTLTRIATSSRGPYTVSFSEGGYDKPNSTIDALREISPSHTTERGIGGLRSSGQGQVDQGLRDVYDRAIGPRPTRPTPP